MSEPDLCAYCGNAAGPTDWADRPWGRIEEPGPGGVRVVRHVHAGCYLYHAKSNRNAPRFVPVRAR